MSEPHRQDPRLPPPDRADLVQRTALFRTLSWDELQRVLAVAREESRRAGETVVEANAMGQALYLVTDGRVRVVRDGAVIGTLGEGELFGEMSLVDDLFTSATVMAETDVTLIAFPRRPFELLVASDLSIAAKIYRAFCRTLSDRLRRANAHLPPQEQLSSGLR